MKSTHNNDERERRAGRACGPLSGVMMLALWGFGSASGCGGDDDMTPMTDGGHRDATIIEEPDAATASDGGVGDASAGDAGFLGCSRAECDPAARDTDACGGDRFCSLSADAPACMASAEEGTLTTGEACAATTDCARGLSCVTRRDGAVCAELCCPDATSRCSDTADRCSGTGTLVDGTETDWWTCVGPRRCDVLAASETCDPGEACYIVSASGETDCRRGGALEVGERCATQEDCSTGLFCLIGASSPTCARVCRIGASAGNAFACPPAEGSCIAYSYSPMGTGICTPPMM